MCLAQKRPTDLISGWRDVWNRQHGTPLSAAHADMDDHDTNTQVIMLMWMIGGHAKTS